MVTVEIIWYRNKKPTLRPQKVTENIRNIPNARGVFQHLKRKNAVERFGRKMFLKVEDIGDYVAPGFSVSISQLT